jgi:hypothetical protein
MYLNDHFSNNGVNIKKLVPIVNFIMNYRVIYSDLLIILSFIFPLAFFSYS